MATVIVRFPPWAIYEFSSYLKEMVLDMILIAFMALLTTVVLLLIIIALRPNSKFCDFEFNISVKSLKIKFKTYVIKTRF
ncbi:hypothetical protein [Clostridium hydrogeniformans]|uniref:hypothetical protein n=1 Tax=Clostridium hydrogeniformans TaxID=349933 RepID=UPI0004827B87|nr:hypothetical protein [Clostridium hydrogeniformans]